MKDIQTAYTMYQSFLHNDIKTLNLNESAESCKDFHLSNSDD